MYSSTKNSTTIINVIFTLRGIQWRRCFGRGSGASALDET
jgi:hypothetical protein